MRLTLFSMLFELQLHHKCYKTCPSCWGEGCQGARRRSEERSRGGTNWEMRSWSSKRPEPHWWFRCFSAATGKQLHWTRTNLDSMLLLMAFTPASTHTHTHTHKHTHTHTHTQSTSVHKSATWLQMFLAHTSEEFNVGRLRVMLQPAHISRKLWHLLTKSRHVQHPAAWYCAFFFTWKIKWKQQPRNFWEIWAELMSSDPETCRK